MRHTLRLGAVTLAAAALATACGGGSKKSGNSGGEGDDAPQNAAGTAADACATAWESYAKAFKTGLVRAYERQTTAEGVVAVARETRRTWRETVKEVTPDAITIERSEKGLLPTETPEQVTTRTVTRASVEQDCRTLAEESGASRTEDLGTRHETVTVKAGAFETEVVKSRQTGTDGGHDFTYDSEIWTIDGAVPVIAKSITDWTTTMNNAPFKQHSVMELTELTIP